MLMTIRNKCRTREKEGKEEEEGEKSDERRNNEHRTIADFRFIVTKLVTSWQC